MRQNCIQNSSKIILNSYLCSGRILLQRRQHNFTRRKFAPFRQRFHHGELLLHAEIFSQQRNSRRRERMTRRRGHGGGRGGRSRCGWYGQKSPTISTPTSAAASMRGWRSRRRSGVFTVSVHPCVCRYSHILKGNFVFKLSLSEMWDFSFYALSLNYFLLKYTTSLRKSFSFMVKYWLISLILKHEKLGLFVLLSREMESSSSRLFEVCQTTEPSWSWSRLFNSEIHAHFSLSLASSPHPLRFSLLKLTTHSAWQLEQCSGKWDVFLFLNKPTFFPSFFSCTKKNSFHFVYHLHMKRDASGFNFVGNNKMTRVFDYIFQSWKHSFS